MKSLASLGSVLSGLLLGLSAQAAVMIANFSPQTGNSWTVDLSVANDGEPVLLSGFTVYFSATAFADLILISAPPSWDSLVVPPDTGLASAGYLDSFLLDRSQALTLGQAQAGFRLQFSHLLGGTPSALAFDIVDENFQVLSSGLTTAVPEPSAWLQSLAGLALLGGLWQRRSAGVRP